MAGITILKEFKSGYSKFSFTVSQHDNRYTGAWFTVHVQQKTDMSSIGEQDIELTFKIVCKHSKTEHAAINFAGKKLIKNWVNLN